MTQPWMKFFGSDWCGDQGLRSCSLAARALWLEMLLVMDRSEPRGSLLLNGKQIDARRLASIVGADKRDVETFFRELDEAGVFSRDDDGTVFSRKMRRDDAKAERDKANGKGGGNPTLKPKDKPPDKPKRDEGLTGRVNPRDKAQKLEARGQKPEAAQPSLVRTEAAGEREWNEIDSAIRQALGDKAPSNFVIGPIISLIRDGVKIEAIVDVLRSESRRERKNPIRTWQTWADIVVEKIAAAPKINGHAIVATPDDPEVDLGPVRDRQSKIINAIQKIGWAGYAGWAETEFGSVEYFRSAVAARAPHLMKFWPAPSATDPAEPALAVAVAK